MLFSLLCRISLGGGRCGYMGCALRLRRSLIDCPAAWDVGNTVEGLYLAFYKPV